MTSQLFKFFPSAWKETLPSECFEVFNSISKKLDENFHNEEPVYPPLECIFNAFQLCSPDNLKVIIIGQDPYHGFGEAHGLAFSTLAYKLPPSLKNIFKEIASDLGKAPSGLNGNLEEWAKQGVLLLNTHLSVIKDQPASHSKIGWDVFTLKVISWIANSGKWKNIVFIAWGAHAHGIVDALDLSDHLVLKSSHPSPFSARKGFFGSKPFSKTNEWLVAHNLAPIDWLIVD